jgi:protein-S-isoprenylcysteine O-methyltransferase Ste14
MLLIRATISFLVLPAIVAGLVPALMVRSAMPDHCTSWLGIATLFIGGFVLLWCARDFYVSGKGTLAPWDPPRHLVVVGPYRFVRNPMYLAVLTVLAGWSLLYASARVVSYMALVAIVFHLRVTMYEEPWLDRQFGAEWEAYRASVSRWLPSFRPRRK